MKTRLRYLPVALAEPGMVLGAQADAVQGGSTSFNLPTGHRLTAENLQQMRAHKVEFVVISEADDRSDQEIANDVAQAARQALLVFKGADLGEPTMACFFEQVWAFRNGRP